MNNKLVFISPNQDGFAQNIKQEAKPDRLTLIQINDLDSIYVSRKFYRNVAIPQIDLLDDVVIPKEYRFIDKICCTNDLGRDFLCQHGHKPLMLNYKWNPIDNELKLSAFHQNLYKYGALFNYHDDKIILQDLLYVFYEANQNIDDVLLVLYISHDNPNEVAEDIQNLHSRINIKPSQTKIILYTKPFFDDASKMALVNVCDAMLLINSISSEELLYNHALFKNRRLISKYKLYQKYNIEVLPTTKKMIKYKNKRSFYSHPDIGALYQSFINKNHHVSLIHNFQAYNTTNIETVLC